MGTGLKHKLEEEGCESKGEELLQKEKVNGINETIKRLRRERRWWYKECRKEKRNGNE